MSNSKNDLLKIIEAVVEIGIIAGKLAPEVIAGVRLAIALVRSNQPPTAEQQTEIDVALKAAHLALQAELEKKLG